MRKSKTIVDQIAIGIIATLIFFFAADIYLFGVVVPLDFIQVTLSFYLFQFGVMIFIDLTKPGKLNKKFNVINFYEQPETKLSDEFWKDYLFGLVTIAQGLGMMFLIGVGADIYNKSFEIIVLLSGIIIYVIYAIKGFLDSENALYEARASISVQILFIIGFSSIVIYGSVEFSWLGAAFMWMFVVYILNFEKKYDEFTAKRTKHSQDTYSLVSNALLIKKHSKIVAKKLDNVGDHTFAIALATAVLILHYFYETLLPESFLRELENLPPIVNIAAMEDKYFSFVFIFFFVLSLLDQYLKALTSISKDIFLKVILVIFFILSMSVIFVMSAILVVGLSEHIAPKINVLVSLFVSYLFFPRILAMMLCLSIASCKSDNLFRLRASISGHRRNKALQPDNVPATRPHCR